MSTFNYLRLYTLISFYKHQVYKQNQAEIIDILKTLPNTSQPQIFGYFSFKSTSVDLIKKIPNLAFDFTDYLKNSMFLGYF